MALLCFMALPHCIRPYLFGLKGFEGVTCLAAFIHVKTQPPYENLP